MTRMVRRGLTVVRGGSGGDRSRTRAVAERTSAFGLLGMARFICSRVVQSLSVLLSGALQVGRQKEGRIMHHRSPNPIVVFALLAVGLMAAAGHARAGGAIVGTNLGFTHVSFERGEGVFMFSLPNQSPLLLGFQPGLRIGGFVSEGKRHEIYVDTGLWFASSDNLLIISAQAMLAYQHSFIEGAVSPIVNVGIGILHVGGDLQTANAPVIGGGIGVRRILAPDRQFEAKECGFVVLPSTDAIGVKLGFDLYL